MSDSDSWCTPAAITGALPPIDLDPCSNENSTVVASRAVAMPDDGLAIDWVGTVWINCPYSNPRPWCAKAVESAAAGANVAMLLKLDPTTKWWASLVTSRLQRVYPFRRRVPFVQPGAKPMVANFPSVLVVLQREPSSPYDSMVAKLRETGWLW